MPDAHAIGYLRAGPGAMAFVATTVSLHTAPPVNDRPIRPR
jgi:hypothetical protein